MCLAGKAIPWDMLRTRVARVLRVCVCACVRVCVCACVLPTACVCACVLPTACCVLRAHDYQQT